MDIRIFSRPGLLGLDVQPDGVRCLRLKRRRKGYVVDHAGICHLPVGVVSGGRIIEAEMFTHAMADYLAQHGLQNSVGAVCLPLSLGRCHVIDVAAKSPHEVIVAEIQMQLQRDLPGMLAKLTFDYAVCPGQRPGRDDVYYAVTRLEHVHQYIDCLTAAGLRLKVMDLDMYAIQRVLAHFLSQSRQNQQAILFLSAQQATFAVFDTKAMILQHVWENAEVVDNHDLIMRVAELKRHAQIDTAVPVLVCGQSQKFNLNGDYQLSLQCVNVDFAAIQIGPNITLHQYALAYGLALREPVGW